MAASLLPQVFAKDIAQHLWAANDFISHAKDDTPWVNFDKVNLPHAGVAPTVTKGALTTGIDNSAIAQRVDSASQYSLQVLRTTPTWIEHNEELLVNYQKRQSVLEGHQSALIDSLADNVLHDWAAGGDSESLGNSVEAVITSSTDSRAVQITQVGATAVTGTRYRIAYADVLAAITVLNRQNIPQGGRYAIITADMFADLLMLAEFKSSDYVNTKPIPGADITFTWLGITWYVRSKVNVFAKSTTTAGVLKEVGANTAAGDCAGGMIWHKDFVRIAKGEVKVFLNIGDAGLQGDKMSALVRYGAIGARTTCKGIVNIIEQWKD